MGFMAIVPATASKRLTCETTFSKYLLSLDAYSTITKNHGTERINTE